MTEIPEITQRLGWLVKNHLHGLAVLEFYEHGSNLPPAWHCLLEGLLKCSSGYTRAILRFFLQEHLTQIASLNSEDILRKPITSPLVLYAGLKRFWQLEPEPLRQMLAQESVRELVECAKQTALVFHDLEKGSKQQKLPGMELRVRELGPAILAILSS